MADEAEKGDGVNRNGLDYRAGWCEAMRALGTRLQVEGMRAKRGEVAGLTIASRIGKEMYDAMLAKVGSDGHAVDAEALRQLLDCFAVAVCRSQCRDIMRREPDLGLSWHGPLIWPSCRSGSG